MATIRKEFPVEASAEQVWDAIRDVGEVARRVSPGFLTDSRMDGDARIVHFANGLTAREVIVSIDDQARRFAYGVAGTTLTHHNASFEVVPDGPARCRVVWLADLLPDDAGPRVAGMMEQGGAAMQRTLSQGDGRGRACR